MKNKKIKKILFGEYQDSRAYIEQQVSRKNYQGALYWQNREELVAELYAELFDESIQNAIKKEEKD